jgi:hypothetical protein
MFFFFGLLSCLFVFSHLSCSQVADSSPDMANAINFTTEQLRAESIVMFHACEVGPDCKHCPIHSTHINSYAVFDSDAAQVVEVTWVRLPLVSHNVAVVQKLFQRYAVAVPVDTTGIPVVDMFTDPISRRRFYYNPTTAAKHIFDRAPKERHHSFTDELWRCGFYIMQTLWLVCTRHVYAEAIYTPHPAWVPGKTSTILSHVAFAKQYTSCFLNKQSIAGVAELSHSVTDVVKLADAINAFFHTKLQNNGTGLFGWKNFSLNPDHCLRMSCHVAKIVADCLASLSFSR